jgi:hypothetical protein
MRPEAPWRGCAEKLFSGPDGLRVVFWLEFDLGHRRRYRDAAQHEADMKAEASTREKQLKRALRWLTKYVVVANQHVDPSVLPGTTVQDIARAGRR